MPNSANENILLFFVVGDFARQLVNWSKDKIKADLINFLSRYTTQGVVIKDIYLSQWVKDPYTFGSFSFAKVGTTE